MMFVPRSYGLQKRHSRDRLKIDEKASGVASGWNVPRPRSALAAETAKLQQKEKETTKDDKPEETSRPATPPSIPTEPVSVPSKPVVIPPRTPSKARTHSSHLRPAQGSRRGSARSYDDKHNARAVPPSVAALLAVTSIPPPNPHALPRRRATSSKSFQKTSIDELIQGWREEETTSLSVSSGSSSHMEMLLERGDDTDTDGGSEVFPSFVDSSFTSRSVSSDSIDSIPDLVLEDRSPLTWESPVTPSTKSRKVVAEKVNSFSEECPLDHPLIASDFDDRPATPAVDTLDFQTSLATPRAKPLPQPAKSSIKSNLTASINALASSLRSFSNFTAPSIPPDDLLTRQIFSPALPQRFSSEMRPKSSEGVPDPALRRYLNPTPRPERMRQQHQRRMSFEGHENEPATASGLSVSSGVEPDFAAAVNASSSLNAPLDLEGPMIQMQTYGVKGKVSKNKKLPSLPPPGRSLNSEAGRIAQAADSSLRQREPRENSDFLRVIVLEMNMRRVGKLDAKGFSRAKVWLPPRRSSAQSTKDDSDEEDMPTSGKKVPLRWVGVSIDDA